MPYFRHRNHNFLWQEYELKLVTWCTHITILKFAISQSEAWSDRPARYSAISGHRPWYHNGYHIMAPLSDNVMYRLYKINWNKKVLIMQHQTPSAIQVLTIISGRKMRKTFPPKLNRADARQLRCVCRQNSNIRIETMGPDLDFEVSEIQVIKMKDEELDEGTIGQKSLNTSRSKCGKLRLKVQSVAYTLKFSSFKFIQVH